MTPSTDPTVPPAGGRRILLVDDDPAVRKAIGRALRLEGYAVEDAADGRRAQEAIRRAPADLLVLDLAMPFVDGLQVCRELRRRGDRTPILVVTARDRADDRIGGLDAGADDYLVKPFDLGELLARVRALLRRAYPDADQAVAVGDLTIDPIGWRAARGPRELQLSRIEFTMLEVLARHAGQVLSRETIVDHVWEYDLGPQSTVIEVYVHHLRKRLEQDGEPRMLHTVRGVGYVLRAA